MASAGPSARSFGDGKLNPAKPLVAETIDMSVETPGRTVSIMIEGTTLTIPANYADAYHAIRAQLLASFRAMTMNAATPADFSIVFGAPTVVIDQNPPQDTVVVPPQSVAVETLPTEKIALPLNTSKGKEVAVELSSDARPEAWNTARMEQPNNPSKAKAKERAAEILKVIGSKRPRAQKVLQDCLAECSIGRIMVLSRCNGAKQEMTNAQ